MTVARFTPVTRIELKRIHGQPRKFGRTVVVPMFHPAAALHQPKYKTLIEADFRSLPKILANIAKVEKADDPNSDPTQLSMF